MIQFITTLKDSVNSSNDVLQVIQWVGRYVLKYVEHCQSENDRENDMSLLVLYDLLKQVDDTVEDSISTTMIQLDPYTSKLLQFSSSLIQQLTHRATTYTTTSTTPQCANIWLAIQLLITTKVDGNTVVTVGNEKLKTKSKSPIKQTLYDRVQVILNNLVTALDAAPASHYSTLSQQLQHVTSASSLASTHTDQLLAMWQAYEVLCFTTHKQQSLNRCKQVMKHHAAHPAVVSVVLALTQALDDTNR